MMLFRGRTPPDPETPGVVEPPKVMAVSWTSGHQLAVTAARILVWGLVACAPVGLVVAVAAFAATSGTAPSAPAISSTEPDGRALAEGTGEQAVTAWLRASRVTPTGTEILPAGDLPDQGLVVSDPSVIDSTFEEGTWIVTVAVTITSDDGTETRRFFTIAVRVENDHATVTGLPAEVASPITAPDDGADAYRQQIPTSDPAASTAGEFLTALLAGGPDINRYLSPDQAGQIVAITPAPYDLVKVVQVTAMDELDSVLVDGDTAEIVVIVRAETDGSSLTLEYPLALTARAGRWEISAVHGAPLPEPTSPVSPNPSASPTTQ